MRPASAIIARAPLPAKACQQHVGIPRDPTGIPPHPLPASSSSSRVVRQHVYSTCGDNDAIT
eukprot:378659-Alexandrium_andersonii.AAC.1